MRPCERSQCMKTYRHRVMCVAVMTLMGGMFARELLAQSSQVPPDLTQSNEVDRSKTYNLGSTGLRGWIYTKPAIFLDSVQGFWSPMSGKSRRQMV